MKCPACKETMVILEHDRVEVDHCLGCGGVWLDAGELELIVGDREKAEQLMASFVRHEAARPRRCPICRAKMQEVVVGERQAISDKRQEKNKEQKVKSKEEETMLELDQCPRGHGIWFDKDELQEAVAAAGAAVDERVKELLGAIFGGRG